jgi:hypothetical protein
MYRDGFCNRFSHKITVKRGLTEAILPIALVNHLTVTGNIR